MLYLRCGGEHLLTFFPCNIDWIPRRAEQWECIMMIMSLDFRQADKSEFWPSEPKCVTLGTLFDLLELQFGNYELRILTLQNYLLGPIHCSHPVLQQVFHKWSYCYPSYGSDQWKRLWRVNRSCVCFLKIITQNSRYKPVMLGVHWGW